MKTRIVRIGNSQGVRIPKPLLEQSGLGEDVELRVEEDRIVILPAGKPRQGWADAFRNMADREDDVLLDLATLPPTEWDVEEWGW